MNLQREVRHKSEDIADDVLSDAVKAIGRRVRVDRGHDIPYIAGYSVDGRTVFIDRHLPRTFRSWTRGEARARACVARSHALSRRAGFQLVAAPSAQGAFALAECHYGRCPNGQHPDRHVGMDL